MVCLVVGSSLLTYTTTPTDLTDALERVLKPLGVLHVPVSDLAMMMTIALLLYPHAGGGNRQNYVGAKGAGRRYGKRRAGAADQSAAAVLVPLFVSSFRRAYELATAMECRCYQGGGGRTRMKQLHMVARDHLALALFLALLAAVITLNFFVPAVL